MQMEEGVQTMSDIQITKKELEEIEWKIKRFEYGVNPAATLVDKLYASYTDQQSIISQQSAEIGQKEIFNVELCKQVLGLEEVVDSQSKQLELAVKALENISEAYERELLDYATTLDECVNVADNALSSIQILKGESQ